MVSDPHRPREHYVSSIGVLKGSVFHDRTAETRLLFERFPTDGFDILAEGCEVFSVICDEVVI